ncbi:hypothetical protein V6N13_112210 [Hibiscus sabdariffa]|uniref:RRM domain-containing protein n=1 Tax=Hibiscus sabdariffa TaxID=183260 RepID=A0ABR2TMH5_9ROSI
MENENPKLFIKEISSQITETVLKEHFSEYGEVKDVLIIAQKNISFVTFSDPSMAQQALQQEHIILGQKVEVKAAKPKVPICDRKIFVGGLPHAITLEAFRQYFEAYGNITDAVVIHDSETKLSRGFGFVTYDSEEAAKQVLQNTFHRLQEKMVEVKKVTPKQHMRNGRGGFRPSPSPTPSTITSASASSGHDSIYDVNSQPYSCWPLYGGPYQPCWYDYYGGYNQHPMYYGHPYYYQHPYYNNRAETNYQPWDHYHPFPCAVPDCQHPYCNKNRM